MCLALLRECEGLFKKRAGGTDAGECSTVDFSRYVFSLLSRECTEEQGYWGGNTERGVAIHRRNQDAIFVFLFIHLSPPLPVVRERS